MRRYVIELSNTLPGWTILSAESAGYDAYLFAHTDNMGETSVIATVTRTNKPAPFDRFPMDRRVIKTKAHMLFED